LSKLQDVLALSIITLYDKVYRYIISLCSISTKEGIMDMENIPINENLTCYNEVCQYRQVYPGSILLLTIGKKTT